MKKFNWKKAEKDFIKNVCKYTDHLKKEGKRPGIRACHLICQNSFGEIFSSMLKFAQMIVQKRLMEEVQMHIDGIDSDLEFQKFIRTYVIYWFYVYRDAEKIFTDHNIKIRPLKDK